MVSSLRVFWKQFLVAVSWEFRKGNICTVWKETLRPYLKNYLVENSCVFSVLQSQWTEDVPSISWVETVYAQWWILITGIYSLELMKLGYGRLIKRMWNLKKAILLATLHVSEEWVVHWTEPEFLCYKARFYLRLKDDWRMLQQVLNFPFQEILESVFPCS